MEKQSGLRRIDWAVVPGCVILALMTLGAIGQSGRGRAKEAVCQANLRQWQAIFQDYIEDNDGNFVTGTYGGYYWPIQLPHEYQDWKRNRAWFCPVAATPMVDEKGVYSPMRSVFSAWGVFNVPTQMIQDGKTYLMNPSGIAGSYGLNGYTLKVTGSYEGGVPAKLGWGGLKDVPHAERVPLFIDALRFDLWPLYTDPPAPDEFAPWSGVSMARCCINRHNGAVNCLFVDGSVRKVGLKELWTLRWYRSFNTAGPWTKAGGVLPMDWPEWLRPFKEY